MRPKITNKNKEYLIGLLNKSPKIAYWQVAEQMGIHENTFSKRMRMPNDAQTAEIADAIAAVRSTL